jgi:hypothetical protein
MNHSARLFIAATLIFAAGCVKQDWIDRTLVTVDVTGVWVLVPDEVLRLELKQEGTKATGSYRWSGWFANEDRGGPLEGTLNGDTFYFNGFGGNLQGEMIVNGDEMNGRLQTKYGRNARSFRRIDPSPPPASPPR